MNLHKRILFFFTVILSFSVLGLAQDKDSVINTSFNDETNKTTVILRGIKLPKNKDDFAVGAYFEFVGEKLEKEPCCVGIFFTLMSRKKFKFEENHNLIIWADKEKFSFDNVNWQEAAGGTAFILSGVAFPEEMTVGMESKVFQKIAAAKNIKMQLGNFKFTLTPKHLSGFKSLAGKMSVGIN